MLIKEIKQALIGKTISYFDGWNGSCDYFKIGYLKKDGTSCSCIPGKRQRMGRIYPHSHNPNAY